MKIKIESILIDNLPVNKKTFDLAMFIYQGGEIPPIKLSKSTLGGYRIKDGRHRVCAYKLLDMKEIEAIICDGISPVITQNISMLGYLTTSRNKL